MKIEIGELRQCMALDLQERVISIIDHKQHDPNYYLLIQAKLDPLYHNKIKTTIVTTQQRPPVLLGTICLMVDNIRGEVKSLWVLPLDIPTFGLTDDGRVVPEAAESAGFVKDAIVYH
jgi:hypothetical protein